MAMRSTTLPNRAGARARTAAVLLLGTGLGALAGCDINEPAMPTFDTTLSLPLGVERLDVIDAVDSEDFLAVGDDGSLRSVPIPDTMRRALEPFRAANGQAAAGEASGD